MAFTEFYCTSLGSNLNGGGLSNGADPGANARYTCTNGNWSTSLNNFRVQDGTNPFGNITIGDYASIYNDGSTVGVYITKITAVDNKVNGNISISSTNAYGTAPTTSTTNRSMKVGGEWLGPNGASTFPFGLAGTLATLSPNAGASPVRVNLKNDQTYSVTVAMNLGSLGGAAVLQGYGTSPGDLGKAILSSNLTSGSNFTCSGSNSQNFIDLVFFNTGAANANHLFSTSVAVFCLRCVFHGARASGFLNSAAIPIFIAECEAYDCNKSNSAGTAGFECASSGGLLICVSCYSHDHSGSNGQGFSSTAISGGMVLINCISESNGGSGLLWNNGVSSAATILASINSDYYNNAGDGIKIASTAAGPFAYLINNNFLKNVGKGINNTQASQPGIIYNNGRGSGSQANGSGDALGAIVDSVTDITYASGVTPWNLPTTGDFSIVLAAAQGVGRSFFTETDGTNAGTLGYPDIGSAQANAITQAPSWAGGDFILPTGYVTHAYLYEWAFSANTSFTLQSGSLPPGLTLATISTTTAEIVGTPTAVGTYNFVLRATVGTSTGDATFHITINADPDEGIGGLLGGLRPTC